MDLTDDERAAIAALERLAKRWPKSLSLFGRAGGDLVVLKYVKGRTFGENTAARIAIPTDGGDPNDDDIY